MLQVTPNIWTFLVNSYNPKKTEPKLGVLLAGQNADSLYATTAVLSETAFDVLAGLDTFSVSLREYAQNHCFGVIVPWLVYHRKEVEGDLQQLIDDYIKPPFSDLLVLKPTSEEGKRHFVMENIHRNGKKYEQQALQIVDPRRVPTSAYRSVSELVNYWVSRDKFEKRGLRLV